MEGLVVAAMICGWLAAFLMWRSYRDEFEFGNERADDWKREYNRACKQRDAALAKLAALKKLLDEGE